MPVKTLVTAEEFLKIVELGPPCDLIRGEVQQLTRASFEHNRIASRIALRLGIWAQQHRRGEVLAGDTGVVVSRDPDTVRGADVLYVSFEKLPPGTQVPGFLQIAPELIVEVLGAHKGLSETLTKVESYLKVGVLRVWVVDPTKRVIHVYQSDRASQVFSIGQDISDAKVLPGFSCRVDEFFAD